MLWTVLWSVWNYFLIKSHKISAIRACWSSQLWFWECKQRQKRQARKEEGKVWPFISPICLVHKTCCPLRCFSPIGEKYLGEGNVERINGKSPPILLTLSFKCQSSLLFFKTLHLSVSWLLKQGLCVCNFVRFWRHNSLSFFVLARCQRNRLEHNLKKASLLYPFAEVTVILNPVAPSHLKYTLLVLLSSKSPAQVVNSSSLISDFSDGNGGNKILSSGCF